MYRLRHNSNQLFLSTVAMITAIVSDSDALQVAEWRFFGRRGTDGAPFRWHERVMVGCNALVCGAGPIDLHDGC